MSESACRIGAVSYLNSKPLVEGLGELLPQTEIVLDYPSRLADHLVKGQLDVALIPSIEYFRGPQYQVISDACVAAHGPVLSVKLYSRVPWGQVQSLALDEGSRTSAALARILLAERHGVFPQLEPLPLDHRTGDAKTDAILLIGDRAILPPSEQFLETWDLGQEWFEWTGLPFVFAMWVASSSRPNDRPRDQERDDNADFGAATHVQSVRDAELDRIGKALCQSRDLGVARLYEIAEREAPKLGLTLPTTIKYLSENLQYQLGRAERSGLKLFYELASKMNLVPPDIELHFRSASS